MDFFGRDICGCFKGTPQEKGAKDPVITLDGPERAIHLDFQVFEKLPHVILKRRHGFYFFRFVHRKKRLKEVRTLCDTGIVPYPENTSRVIHLYNASYKPKNREMKHIFID